jgi:hypothetical protein
VVKTPPAAKGIPATGAAWVIAITLIAYYFIKRTKRLK